METKLFEIRDRMTMFIALCVDMNSDNYNNLAECKALRYHGFPNDGRPNIMFTHANGRQRCDNDPYGWGDRTYATAHHYILDNWKNLKSGDVVDVEHILGETTEKKVSELIY